MYLSGSSSSSVWVCLRARPEWRRHRSTSRRRTRSRAPLCHCGGRCPSCARASSGGCSGPIDMTTLSSGYISCGRQSGIVPWGHVYGYGQIGREPMRRGLRAARADLLLRRGHKAHFTGELYVAQQPRAASHMTATHARSSMVLAARLSPASSVSGPAERHQIAHAHQFAHARGVHAQIDIHVLEFEVLLAVGRGSAGAGAWRLSRR